MAMPPRTAATRFPSRPRGNKTKDTPRRRLRCGRSRWPRWARQATAPARRRPRAAGGASGGRSTGSRLAAGSSMPRRNHGRPASASSHIRVTAFCGFPPMTHREVSSTTCLAPAARMRRRTPEAAKPPRRKTLPTPSGAGARDPGLRGRPLRPARLRGTMPGPVGGQGPAQIRRARRARR